MEETKTSGNRWNRTKKDWLEIWNKVHNNKFDYQLVPDFFLGKDRIIVICPTHGQWETTATAHAKRGCSGCWNDRRGTKTREEWIKLLSETHNNEYDYSKLPNELGYNTRITIVCPKHGDFEMKTANHYSNKNKCPKCSYENRFTSKEEWLRKFKEAHNDKYDYSKSDIVDNKTPIIIICPEHGEFKQAPMAHSLGQGCLECYNKYGRGKGRKISKEEFIQRARKVHGDKYDYTNTIIGIQLVDKGWIKCPEHGLFEQSLSCHLSGDGCAKCSGKYNLSNEEYLEECERIYGTKYDLSKVKFVNNNSNVIIGCKEHGFVEVNARSFKRGHGCIKCNLSKGENIIAAYLEANDIKYVREYVIKGSNTRFRYDFHILGTNILIEYDGKQHFEPIEIWGGVDGLLKRQEYDQTKNSLAVMYKYNLIRLNYEMDLKLIPKALYNKLYRHYKYYHDGMLFRSTVELSKHLGLDFILNNKNAEKYLFKFKY